MAWPLYVHISTHLIIYVLSEQNVDDCERKTVYMTSDQECSEQ